MSELVKEIKFGDDCQKSLLEGVELMAKAVKSTLGTHGQTVFIESPTHVKGYTVTKDGFTVAKSITLNDPVANMACMALLEAAEKTATNVGDGTSTSIVLAEALIKGGVSKITPDLNKTEVLRETANIVETVIDILRSKKIDCTDSIMANVATISCNNDEVTGNLIAEAYKGVGKDGIVTVEKSPSHKTTFEVVNGLKVDRGYSSPLFMNNVAKEECVLENVHILVCDTEISQASQIMSILEGLFPSGKKLLIIAPCSQPFINSMVHNVLKSKIGLCIIQPPNFGYKQHEQMEDIAISVGAKYFSKTTEDLSLITLNDLGFAEKVIVGKSKTIIVGGHGDSEEMATKAEQLKSTLSNRNAKHEIDYINERVASLIGGVGVIYVGGNTDLEQKELYDRVDDAVCAVRSAMEEGVVSGAGKALFEIDLTPQDKASKEFKVALEIVMEAIKVPLVQILLNAGLDYKEVYKDITIEGNGYNLKTKKYGNLIEMGVIDPFKVTRTALQNALSVATTILSTSASINIVRA